MRNNVVDVDVDDLKVILINDHYCIVCPFFVAARYWLVHRSARKEFEEKVAEKVSMCTNAGREEK